MHRFFPPYIVFACWVLFERSLCVFANPKFTDLKALKAQRGCFIELNNLSEYTKWITPADERPYHAVVVYYAPTNRCRACGYIVEFVKKTSKVFEKAGACQFTDEGHDERMPVLFFSVDAASNLELAAMHQITSVPTIALVRRNLPVSTKGATRTIAANDFYKGDSDSSDEFIKWIGFKTGWNVSIPKRIVEHAVITTVLTTVICVGGAVVWKLSEVIRRNTWIMGISALGVQLIGLSGVCWSLQHGLQLYGIHPHTREKIFIMPNRRSQYVGEGVVAAFLTTGIGMSLYLFAKTAKSKHFRTRRWTTCAALFGIAAVQFTVLWHAFGIKTGLSSLPFMPPGNFQKGPLAHDRGNSF